MKKKKALSRRQRALRNIMIAVLVIVLHVSVSSYSLTPHMALEYAKKTATVSMTLPRW